ncbi:MAG: hypothetical protein ACI396_09900, partial [Acutalibacteraceae bacterium]
MSKISETEFYSRLPRYTLMSLMFGFIMTFVSRTIYSSALGVEIYTTQMFSQQTIGVFIASVVAALFLIYVFTSQAGGEHNGKLVLFVRRALNSP